MYAEGLIQIVYYGRQVWRIPEMSGNLKKRVLICAHTKEVEHRGVDATLQRLQRYCVWFAYVGRHK